MQATYGWIDSVPKSSLPIRLPPTATQFNNGQDLKSWGDNEPGASPFYQKRPNIPFYNNVSNFADSTAQGASRVGHPIPMFAYNFNDFEMSSVDGVGSWMVETTQPGEKFIHTILLNDNGGIGTMGSSTVAKQNPGTA